MSRQRVQELERVKEELENYQYTNRQDERGLPYEARNILDCIHENLFDPELSVKTLRALCGVRDNNVSSRFRWFTGTTIKEYIENLRMEAASHLLRESGCSIFDIVHLVGYNYPQTFYRAFEKIFDCTPAMYRQRYQEDELDISQKDQEASRWL